MHFIFGSPTGHITAARDLGYGPMLARLVAAASLSIAACASAAEIDGIVTDVHDGDTLTLVN